MRQVESVRGLTGDAAATRRDDVACSSVEHMKSAVESLPALLEQKKELEGWVPFFQMTPSRNGAD